MITAVCRIEGHCDNCDEEETELLQIRISSPEGRGALLEICDGCLLILNTVVGKQMEYNEGKPWA